jgi:hypothetical protein
MKITITIETDGFPRTRFQGEDDYWKLWDALYRFLDQRAAGYIRPFRSKDERLREYQFRYFAELYRKNLDLDSKEAHKIFQRLWRQYRKTRERELGKTLNITGGRGAGAAEYKRFNYALKVRTRLAMSKRWIATDRIT